MFLGFFTLISTAANRRLPYALPTTGTSRKLSSFFGMTSTAHSFQRKSHINEFLRSSSELKASNKNREFTSTYALIVANSETVTAPVIRRIWNNFDYRICADGGANRLFDAIIDLDPDADRSLYVPNAIKGDLDSLRDDVRSFYASIGCDIIQDDDQDTNDLEKCIVAAISDYGARQWAGQAKVCFFLTI
jgi:hypothetical protein